MGVSLLQKPTRQNKPAGFGRQAGASIRTILLISGFFCFLLITLVALLSSGKKDETATGTAGNGNASNSSSSTSSSNPLNKSVAAVENIPSNFKAYKNSAYGFSFAYPTSWGDMFGSGSGGASDSSFVFGQATMEFTQPIGNATLNNKLKFSMHVREGFSLPVNGNNNTVPYVMPIVNKQTGPYDWQYDNDTPASSGRSSGDRYKPVRTITSDGGVIMYDLSWTVPQGAQARWVFQIDENNFGFLSLPPIVKTDSVSVTQNDYQKYVALSTAIAKSVATNAAAASKPADSDSSN